MAHNLQHHCFWASKNVSTRYWYNYANHENDSSISHGIVRAKMISSLGHQIQSHHSYPPVSTLAKDNWAHWIQAPLTHLQSSDNHRTFISVQPHHSSASLQHTLFIFGHSRSSIHNIFFTNNRSFLPVCFPSSLESTPGPPPSTPH